MGPGRCPDRWFEYSLLPGSSCHPRGQRRSSRPTRQCDIYLRELPECHKYLRCLWLSDPGVSTISTSNQSTRADVSSARVTKTYLDSEGKTLQVDQPNPSASNAVFSSTTSYAYSSSDRTVEVIQTDPTNLVNKSKLNALGLTLVDYEPYPSTGNPTISPKASFKHDAAGRVVYQQEDGASTAPNTYDITKFGYDFATGGLALQIKTTKNPTAETDQQRIEQTFDSAGNLLVSTDRNMTPTSSTENVIRTYDGLGRITLEKTTVDTFTPGTFASTGTADVTRTWDYNGPAVLYKDRNNQYTLQINDPANNRVDEFWYPSTANFTQLQAVSSLTDLTNVTVSPTRAFRTILNSDGSPKSISEYDSTDFNADPRSSNVFQYDSRGQKVNEEQSGLMTTFVGDTLARVTASLASTWHSIGVRDELQVSIDRQGDSVTQQTLIGTYKQNVDDSGVVTQITKTSSGASDQFWLKSIPAEAQTFLFKYDAAGRKQSIERFDSADSTGTPTGYTYFGYDSSQRLVSAKHYRNVSEANLDTSGVPTSDPTVSAFTTIRDANGRVAQRTVKLLDPSLANPASGTPFVNDTFTYQYGYNGLQSVTKNGALQDKEDYDSAGNRTQGGVVGLDDRATSAPSAFLQYDAEGRVIRRYDTTVVNTLDDLEVNSILEHATVSPGTNGTQEISQSGYFRYNIDTLPAGRYILQTTWRSYVDGTDGTYFVTDESANPETEIGSVNFLSTPRPDSRSQVETGTDAPQTDWQSIGEFTTTSSMNARIILRKASSGSPSGVIIADAIRILKVDTETLYTYDQRGRLTETREWRQKEGSLLKDVSVYTYDPLNRLVGRDSRTFDSSGTLVSQQRVGYILDGQQVLYEVTLPNPDSSTLPGISQDYVYAPDGSLLVTDMYGSADTGSIPTPLYAFTDIDGTVATLAKVDDSTNPPTWSVQHRVYDTFGKRTQTYGLTIGDGDSTKVFSEAPEIWQGLRRDSITGLSQIGSRWYDTTLARFLTPGQSTLGDSPYTLDGNDPFKTIDSPDHILQDDNTPWWTLGRHAYLFTHPWQMDTDLQVGFYTSGIVGLVAAPSAATLAYLGIGTAALSTGSASLAIGTSVNAIGLTHSITRYRVTGEGLDDVLTDTAGTLAFGAGAYTKLPGFVRAGLFALDFAGSAYQGSKSFIASRNAYANNDIIGGRLNAISSAFAFIGAASAVGMLRQSGNFLRTFDDVIPIPVPQRTRLTWNEFRSQVGGHGYSQKQISRLYGKYLDSKGIEKAVQSKHLQYLGSNPTKDTPTGKAVIERMRTDGRVLDTSAGTFVKDVDGNFYPLAEMDMGHFPVDAVTYWNTIGINYGPKSQVVRQWMLDPNNYELQHFSRNRSLGAQIGETYIDP